MNPAGFAEASRVLREALDAQADLVVCNRFGALEFQGQGFADELQAALRSPALFERWRDLQDDPEGVNASLGACDPSAVVTGEQDDLTVRLQATTVLPGEVFKHRLRLLAGSHWELRDVTSA